MPDALEIEIKYAIADPHEFRARLLQAGARSEGSHFEDNFRLDDARSSLAQGGRVLRIRRVEVPGADAHTLLTVKVPAVADGFPARREIELAVEDATLALAALQALGFRVYWRYQKRRETFRWGDLEVVLDELPFGYFAELEGPPAAIRAGVAALHLDPSEGLLVSYAQLAAHVSALQGLPLADMTFEEYTGGLVDVEAYAGLRGLP